MSLANLHRIQKVGNPWNFMITYIGSSFRNNRASKWNFFLHFDIGLDFPGHLLQVLKRLDTAELFCVWRFC